MTVQLELTCYRLANAVELAPARPTRAIFDRNKHAYRCLPLSTANAAGWELLCPDGFTATWDGGDGVDAVTVVFDNPDAHPFAKSHFAYGILTFDTGWLMRTSEGFGLWVMGPPNEPKDGLYPLAGLVETSWLNYTFTMNWQFTRPGSVRFEKGEPFGFVTPGPIQAIAACEPLERDLAEDPTVQADLAAWTAERSALVTRMEAHDPDALKQAWGRRYFKGEAPPGATTPPPGHVHKMRTQKLRRPTPLLIRESSGTALPAPASASEPTPSTASRIVRSQAEAEALGLDFLVLDHVLDAAGCRALSHAFIAHSEACASKESDEFWKDRIVRASVLAAVAPEAAALMRATLDDALERIAAFYRVDAPLYPDTLNLVGWREGMSMPLHADNGYREGDTQPLAHRAYSGLLYLNDDFDGGGLYLPAQDVLIMPQPGMLVSLPAGESHVHGVTRVERGVRLTMPFFLTFDRTKALGSAPTSRAKPQLDFGGLGVAGFADALSFEGAE